MAQDRALSAKSVCDPITLEIVRGALAAFGRVDILVNNAGILRDRIFHRMSWSDWSDVLAVHLHGSFNMSRACAVHFREQKSGAFVHMTSTSALVGNFGQANYMAAKFGIVGLSRGIALDMARFKDLPVVGSHVEVTAPTALIFYTLITVFLELPKRRKAEKEQE